jgi:hypothetical protein
MGSDRTPPKRGESSVFDVLRWRLLLHREARQMPRASPEDPAGLRLEDEIIERLYTGEGERLPPPKMNPRAPPRG